LQNVRGNILEDIMLLREKFEKETGEPAIYNPHRVMGEAIRVNHEYLEWLETQLQNTSSNSEYKQCEYCHGTKLLCSGAGQCDHDGRDCNKNDNCGEYTPALCKYCTN
jgi:hypothetical protein